MSRATSRAAGHAASSGARAIDARDKLSAEAVPYVRGRVASGARAAELLALAVHPAHPMARSMPVGSHTTTSGAHVFVGTRANAVLAAQRVGFDGGAAIDALPVIKGATWVLVCLPGEQLCARPLYLIPDVFSVDTGETIANTYPSPGGDA